MVKQPIFWRKVTEIPNIEMPSKSFQRTRKQFSSVRNHFQILMKTRFKESNTTKGTEVAIFKEELHVLDEEKWRWQGLNTEVTEGQVTKCSPLHRYSSHPRHQ